MAKLAKRKNVDSPLMVEGLAIEEALDLAIQCGWRKVGFFSDSKVAIDAITKP